MRTVVINTSKAEQNMRFDILFRIPFGEDRLFWINEELQERTDYAGKIRQFTVEAFDKIVVCVPKDMFAIIKDSLPDGRVIAVTNEIYKEECARRGWTYLPRVGARVGNENHEKILEIIRAL